MGIGLSNVKLSVAKSPSEYISKPKKARPSIAEDAIFIAKPKKRVSFELADPIKDKGGTASSLKGKGLPLPGSGSGGEVKLPGDGSSKPEDTGAELAPLGKNGVSAKLTSAQYGGEPTEGYVKMEVDYVPEKDHSWDAPQEEGRQINNHQVPFQLQYDSYGRPRIGFSREPYDFAATKYIQLTSQIKFNQNVGKTKEHFEQYFLGNNASEEEMKALFAVGSDDSAAKPFDPPPLVGEEEEGENSKNKEIKLIGDGSDEKEVSDNQVKDKKDSEQFFLDHDNAEMDKEIEKILLGNSISPEENKNKEDNAAGESASEDISSEENEPSVSSGFKTAHYESASMGEMDTGQFSVRV
jgi:hypothetical protein